MIKAIAPVLLRHHPLASAALAACLLASLTACASNPNSQALETSFAADPRLKENPAAFGATPTPTPSKAAQKEPPADFPAEIPLYPEADLVGTEPAASGSQLSRWQTADPTNFVQAFYQKQFSANGWQIISQNPADAQNNNTDTIAAKRENLQVTVTIQPISSPNSSPSPTSTAAQKNAEFAIAYTRNAAAASPTPSAPAASPSPAASPAASATFTDLNKVPPSLRQYVEDVAALGVLIINNISNKNSPVTQFEPNKVVTKREFARWLMAANNKIYTSNPGKQIRLAAETSTPAFADVPKADRDFAAIQGLAEAGLIPSSLSGDATNVLFRPDAPLTRETLLLWKVPLDTRQALPGATLDAVKQTWGFQDASKIDPKALKAVLADFQSGDSANIRRLFGYTTLFQPKKPVSRAEAAATLWYFGSQGEGISAREARQS